MMKFKFNKNNFLHSIQDNGCCTLRIENIYFNIYEIIGKYKISTSEISDKVYEISVKHNGEYRQYRRDSYAEAIFINRRKDQQAFLNELNIYLDEVYAYGVAMKLIEA